MATTTFTKVERYSETKRSPIAIRPYFDDRIGNMGLEKYGMSLYEGVKHMEQLACLEFNGIKRYVTGLNEFAPEIKSIPDPELREAIIRDIRSVIAELEKELAANVIDVEDKDFWAKVKLLSPNNDDFWGKIEIKAGNEPIYLDPKDPYDLVKLYAINAGGFSIVARSYEEARSKMPAPKFYLDKHVETVSTKTESKKLRNKALSELQKLFDKNTNKLLYIAKVVDTASAQYRKSTPNDVIYDNMDNFINGQGSEKNANRAAQMFLDSANLGMEVLKLKAMVKDATFYKFIVTKADGFVYTAEKNMLLGRNQADAVEYLGNPLHEDVLVDLMQKVEKYWNQ
jgi:hypothetical protein|tara:strand:- start:2579 stop:3601 length:1023 start_codon:yes stop_codon:yes gene_type:complete